VDRFSLHGFAGPADRWTNVGNEVLYNLSNRCPINNVAFFRKNERLGFPDDSDFLE
jgi:hypothetical protein